MPSPEPQVSLIVNADDFGRSADTVAATIECFEAGALTSATVMPEQPASKAAVAFARSRPDLGFGVHLTFTRDVAERPLCDPVRVQSLVDAEGRLFAVRDLRARTLLGRIEPADLECEIEAQVRWLRERGVPVTHVDSHLNLHRFRPFRAALARVLPGLGITRVRGAQDLYLTRHLRSPTYWLGRRWLRQISAAFDTTDHFYMPAKSDPPWADDLLELLSRLPSGSIEIGVHPGRDEPWRDRDRVGTLDFARRLDGRAALVDWRAVGSGP